MGGTLGAVLGAAITSGLSQYLSAASLLLVSALLLEIAAWSARAVDRQEDNLAREGPAASERVIGGGVLEGIRDIARSPYLLAVAGLAVVSTTVAFIFYYRLIADVGPVKAITVTLLVPVMDYAGMAMFHCHILDHEDKGMMGILEVRP